jgi:hypothetical protein
LGGGLICTAFAETTNRKESKMVKKFSELRAGMTQAARARSDTKAKVMLAEMSLKKLRPALPITSNCRIQVCA